MALPDQPVQLGLPDQQVPRVPQASTEQPGRKVRRVSSPSSTPGYPQGLLESLVRRDPKAQRVRLALQVPRGPREPQEQTAQREPPGRPAPTGRQARLARRACLELQDRPDRRGQRALLA